MSMDVHLQLFSLCLFFTAYTWAGPLSTASLVSLTPYLANKVPICAHPCLQTFVADSFPSSVCSSPTIDCLCTSDSESGYTIGEGALVCLESDCVGWDRDEVISAYEVCSNVDNAMPNTHSVITAYQTSSTPASDATYIATSTGDSSSHHPSFASTLTQQSIISSTSSAFTSTFTSSSAIKPATSSPSSSATHAPSSSIHAVPASTTPNPQPSPVLTKPQIAGVVVSSVGASALALGLCSLLFCCRYRKQKRRHSASSFGGDKVVGSTTDSTPDLAIIAARDFGHDPEGKEVVNQDRAKSPPQPSSSVATPATTGEGGWSQWRRNTAPQDIGLALAPGIPTPSHPSPITPSSHRTRNSQLLPDKPSHYSLFPAPLRPSPHSRRASQNLEAQLAARVSSGIQPSPSTTSVPPLPTSLETSQAASTTTTRGEISPRNALTPLEIVPYMQAARVESGYQPYLHELPSNPATVPQQWSEPPSVLPRKPLPAHASPSARGLRLGQSIHHQYQHQRPPHSQFQAYRRPKTPPPPPPSTGPPTVHLEVPTTNTDSSIASTRKYTSDSRPPTWLSTGSETSFEDADPNEDDEDDIPEPVSALSPVKEHPSSPLTETSIHPRSHPQRPPPPPHNFIRHSAKQQILQSPKLSKPLNSFSDTDADGDMDGDGARSSLYSYPHSHPYSNSNSPRLGMMHMSDRTAGAGFTPPRSGWPGGR